MEVQIEGGKYTYRMNEHGSVVLRYGEPWKDATGDKLIYCMASEIERLRAELEDEKGRVEHWKSVHVDWLEKTQWVQDSLEPKELGKHRADILRERLAAANAEIAKLKSTAWGY